MTTHELYLRSFDRHAEMLAYDVDRRLFRVIERKDFERLGVPRTFGAFTREGDDVYGVFASPDGPVLFKNDVSRLGQFGRIEAEVRFGEDKSTHQFELRDDGAELFSAIYRERDGVGTNPYDTSREDVDLFAMLASALKKPQFFENYTRPWMTAGDAPAGSSVVPPRSNGNDLPP